jgi:hypothetical protein
MIAAGKILIVPPGSEPGGVTNSSGPVRCYTAQQSRLWAGIHFPIDTEMGPLGGGMIGRLVVARAREDGAE